MRVLDFVLDFGASRAWAWLRVSMCAGFHACVSVVSRLNGSGDVRANILDRTEARAGWTHLRFSWTTAYFHNGLERNVDILMKGSCTRRK